MNSSPGPVAVYLDRRFHCPRIPVCIDKSSHPPGQYSWRSRHRYPRPLHIHSELQNNDHNIRQFTNTKWHLPNFWQLPVRDEISKQKVDTLMIIIMGRMGICFMSVATSWWGEACCLLSCRWDNMAAILQRTFSNCCSSMKIAVYCFKFTDILYIHVYIYIYKYVVYMW